MKTIVTGTDGNSQASNEYNKCSKISNMFHFQGLEFTKVLVRIANREDPDQAASSEAV